MPLVPSILDLLVPKEGVLSSYSLKKENKLVILKVKLALSRNSEHILLTMGSDVLH